MHTCRFILLLLGPLLMLGTVTGIQCLYCKSEPGCQNKEECEQSCRGCQRLVTCDDPPDQSCINTSYSYVEQDESIKFVFEQKCGFDPWGCQDNCQIPKHFGSEDCEVSCCKENGCNGDVDPLICLISRDTGIVANGFQTFLLVIVAMILTIVGFNGIFITNYVTDR